MQDSIPGPWDHDLSRRQMLHRVSPPGAPKLLFANRLEQDPAHRRPTCSTLGLNEEVGNGQGEGHSGCLLSCPPSVPASLAESFLRSVTLSLKCLAAVAGTTQARTGVGGVARGAV